MIQDLTMNGDPNTSIINNNQLDNSRLNPYSIYTPQNQNHNLAGKVDNIQLQINALQQLNSLQQPNLLNSSFNQMTTPFGNTNLNQMLNPMLTPMYNPMLNPMNFNQFLNPLTPNPLTPTPQQINNQLEIQNRQTESLHNKKHRKHKKKQETESEQESEKSEEVV